MQMQNEADYRSLSELQCLIEEAESPRDRNCRQYVFDAFKGKMKSLIPFAFENESVMKIA